MHHDFETFTPDVQWSTVRCFLVLAMILGWKTVSVYWVNAFIQSNLEEPIFVHLPKGFSSTLGSNTCLKLKKSLYGTSIAPRLWWLHLRKALLSIGMKESQHDQCLLYRPGLLMVLYVGDAGLAAPTMQVIRHFAKQLKGMGLDMDIEDHFNENLGISIDDNPDGTKTMTQKGLIQKTLKAAKMGDCNPNWTPVHQVALGSDSDGKPHDQSKWHYASIVGMLLYLANDSQDLTSALQSQVARFSNNPKKSHASAVQVILRYLKRTADKGLIVKPVLLGKSAVTAAI
jgi:Reverse transcriptase (RNA-dependent DNA polymerase)